MEQETQEQTNKFNNKIYYILPEFSGKVVVCHHQKLGFKSNDWWLFFAKYNYRVYTAIIFRLTPCTSPSSTV